MYKEELHLNYQKTIQAFVKAYPFVNADMVMQIDRYSRDCALCLWDSLSVDLHLCTETINELYASEDSRCTFTDDQVQNQLDELRKQHYVISVPPFFQQIAERDGKEKTDFSRRLASCFKLLMIMFALSDGAVQQAEIKIIAELYSKLILVCDTCHVKAYKDNVNIFDLAEEDTSDLPPQPVSLPSVPTPTQSQPVMPKAETTAKSMLGRRIFL